ncbi:MAG: hypothetical protein Q8S03_12920 [Brevundimonas sp.]|uniref:hypothetical protein n=1 Tax=Brevundimonas sp. TaxID=1871086 RepID=UPI00273505F8|nr:hypothetical protein [Brevundimonas sp.]MDP3405590.1 hypothetical protein [Brevundimonas sp.]
MWENLYQQLFLLPVIIVGIFAFAKGDEPERMAMGAYLLLWLAAMLVQNESGLAKNIQPALFGLDFAMLLVLAGVAWKYKRSWPVWAASLQLVVIMSHLVIFLDFSPGMSAFYTILNLASYGILLTIGIGSFWAWQERRAAGLE